MDFQVRRANTLLPGARSGRSLKSAHVQRLAPCRAALLEMEASRSRRSRLGESA